MNDKDEHDDFDDDNEPNEIDEYEITAKGKRPTVDWRRIEFMKEQLAMKKEIADYDEYM